MALSLFAWGTPQAGGESPAVSGTRRLQWVNSVRISVPKQQLTGRGGDTALSIGVYRGKSADFQGTPATLRLEYRLENLWELELPNEPASFPRVSYLVSGDKGEPGHLGQDSAPLHADIQALPPRSLRTADKYTVWTGDAILSLDIAEVSAAGAYRGALSITVEYEE